MQRALNILNCLTKCEKRKKWEIGLGLRNMRWHKQVNTWCIRRTGLIWAAVVEQHVCCFCSLFAKCDAFFSLVKTICVSRRPICSVMIIHSAINRPSDYFLMWSLFPPALCPQPNLILLRGVRVLTTVLFYMIHYYSSRIVEFNTGYDGALPSHLWSTSAVDGLLTYLKERQKSLLLRFSWKMMCAASSVGRKKQINKCGLPL